VRWCSTSFVRIAAALLAVVGLSMLYTATGHEKLQQHPDALFQFTSETTLVLAGVSHLVFSVTLFLTRERMHQGFLTLWMGLVYLAYHTGMALLKVEPPYPMIQLVAWKFGMHARVTNGFWNLFTAYLIMGSILFLMFEWKRLGQTQDEAFLKHYMEGRKPKGTPDTPASRP
jgi:hypothetical protein